MKNKTPLPSERSTGCTGGWSTSRRLRPPVQAQLWPCWVTLCSPLFLWVRYYLPAIIKYRVLQLPLMVSSIVSICTSSLGKKIIRGMKRSKNLSISKLSHTTRIRGDALVALTLRGEVSLEEHPGDGLWEEMTATA